MESYYIYEMDQSRLYTFSGGMVNIDEDMTGGTSSIQISPDEKFAVSAGYNKLVTFDLSNPQDPNKQQQLDYTAWSVLRGSISPDSKFYYNRAEDALKTFSVDQTTFALTEIGSIALSGEDVREVHVGPDGKFLYSKSRNQVKVYSRDIETGLLTAEPSKTIDFGGSDAVNNEDISSISPDGQKFAIGMTGANKLAIYDIDTSTGELSSPIETSRTLAAAGAYHGVSFSDDSAYLYAAPYTNSKIYVYKVEDFSEVQAIELPDIMRNHNVLISISRGFNTLYAAPHTSTEKDDEKIWKFNISGSDGTITHDSDVLMYVGYTKDLAVINENKILGSSISAPMGTPIPYPQPPLTNEPSVTFRSQRAGAWANGDPWANGDKVEIKDSSGTVVGTLEGLAGFAAKNTPTDELTLTLSTSETYTFVGTYSEGWSAYGEEIAVDAIYADGTEAVPLFQPSATSTDDATAEVSFSIVAQPDRSAAPAVPDGADIITHAEIQEMVPRVVNYIANPSGIELFIELRTEDTSNALVGMPYVLETTNQKDVYRMTAALPINTAHGLQIPVDYAETPFVLFVNVNSGVSSGGSLALAVDGANVTVDGSMTSVLLNTSTNYTLNVPWGAALRVSGPAELYSKGVATTVVGDFMYGDVGMRIGGYSSTPVALEFSDLALTTTPDMQIRPDEVSDSLVTQLGLADGSADGLEAVDRDLPYISKADFAATATATVPFRAIGMSFYVELDALAAIPADFADAKYGISATYMNEFLLSGKAVAKVEITNNSLWYDADKPVLSLHGGSVNLDYAKNPLPANVFGFDPATNLTAGASTIKITVDQGVFDLDVASSSPNDKVQLCTYFLSDVETTVTIYGTSTDKKIKVADPDSNALRWVREIVVVSSSIKLDAAYTFVWSSSHTSSGLKDTAYTGNNSAAGQQAMMVVDGPIFGSDGEMTYPGGYLVTSADPTAKPEYDANGVLQLTFAANNATKRFDTKLFYDEMANKADITVVGGAIKFDGVAAASIDIDSNAIDHTDDAKDTIMYRMSVADLLANGTPKIMKGDDEVANCVVAVVQSNAYDSDLFADLTAETLATFESLYQFVGGATFYLNLPKMAAASPLLDGLSLKFPTSGASVPFALQNKFDFTLDSVADKAGAPDKKVITIKNTSSGIPLVGSNVLNAKVSIHEGIPATDADGNDVAAVDALAAFNAPRLASQQVTLVGGADAAAYDDNGTKVFLLNDGYFYHDNSASIPFNLAPGASVEVDTSSLPFTTETKRLYAVINLDNVVAEQYKISLAADSFTYANNIIAFDSIGSGRQEVLDALETNVLTHVMDFAGSSASGLVINGTSYAIGAGLPCLGEGAVYTIANVPEELAFHSTDGMSTFTPTPATNFKPLATVGNNAYFGDFSLKLSANAKYVAIDGGEKADAILLGSDGATLFEMQPFNTVATIAISGLLNAPLPLGTTFEIEMSDSFGDSWNGNSFTIMDVNGVMPEVALTGPASSMGTNPIYQSFHTMETTTLRIEKTSAYYYSEVRLSIKANGEEVATHATAWPFEFDISSEVNITPALYKVKDIDVVNNAPTDNSDMVFMLSDNNKLDILLATDGLRKFEFHGIESTTQLSTGIYKGDGTFACRVTSDVSEDVFNGVTPVTYTYGELAGNVTFTRDTRKNLITFDKTRCQTEWGKTGDQQVVLAMNIDRDAILSGEGLTPLGIGGKTFNFMAYQLSNLDYNLHVDPDNTNKFSKFGYDDAQDTGKKVKYTDPNTGETFNIVQAFDPSQGWYEDDTFPLDPAVLKPEIVLEVDKEFPYELYSLLFSNLGSISFRYGKYVIAIDGPEFDGDGEMVRQGVFLDDGEFVTTNGDGSLQLHLHESQSLLIDRIPETDPSNYNLVSRGVDPDDSTKECMYVNGVARGDINADYKNHYAKYPNGYVMTAIDMVEYSKHPWYKATGPDGMHNNWRPIEWSPWTSTVSMGGWASSKTGGHEQHAPPGSTNEVTVALKASGSAAGAPNDDGEDRLYETDAVMEHATTTVDKTTADGQALLAAFAAAPPTAIVKIDGLVYNADDTDYMIAGTHVSLGVTDPIVLAALVGGTVKMHSTGADAFIYNPDNSPFMVHARADSTNATTVAALADGSAKVCGDAQELVYTISGRPVMEIDACTVDPAVLWNGFAHRDIEHSLWYEKYGALSTEWSHGKHILCESQERWWPEMYYADASEPGQGGKMVCSGLPNLKMHPPTINWETNKITFGAENTTDVPIPTGEYSSGAPSSLSIILFPTIPAEDASGTAITLDQALAVHYSEFSMVGANLDAVEQPGKYQEREPFVHTDGKKYWMMTNKPYIYQFNDSEFIYPEPLSMAYRTYDMPVLENGFWVLGGSAGGQTGHWFSGIGWYGETDDQYIIDQGTSAFGSGTVAEEIYGMDVTNSDIGLPAYSDNYVGIYVNRPASAPQPAPVDTSQYAAIGPYSHEYDADNQKLKMEIGNQGVFVSKHQKGNSVPKVTVHVVKVSSNADDSAAVGSLVAGQRLVDADGSEYYATTLINDIGLKKGTTTIRWSMNQSDLAAGKFVPNQWYGYYGPDFDLATEGYPLTAPLEFRNTYAIIYDVDRFFENPDDPIGTSVGGKRLRVFRHRNTQTASKITVSQGPIEGAVVRNGSTTGPIVGTTGRDGSFVPTGPISDGDILYASGGVNRVTEKANDHVMKLRYDIASQSDGGAIHITQLSTLIAELGAGQDDPDDAAALTALGLPADLLTKDPNTDLEVAKVNVKLQTQLVAIEAATGASPMDAIVAAMSGASDFGAALIAGADAAIDESGLSDASKASVKATVASTISEVDASADVSAAHNVERVIARQYAADASAALAAGEEIQDFDTAEADVTNVSGALNLYIGAGDFNAKTLNEIGGEELDATKPNFDQVEYTVSVPGLKGSDLLAALSNVAMAVSVDQFDDFVDNIDDRLDNARTYQPVAGTTFDLAGADDIGMKPAALRGNFNDSVGLDAIDMPDGSKVGLDLVADTDIVTASALPKVLGAQLPFTSGREEVLRMVVDESNFRKLANFSLRDVGAENNSGVVQSLQKLIHSNATPVGYGMAYDDMTTEFSRSASQRAIGHEILASLFRADPASHTNTSTPNAVVADATWEHESADYLTLKKLTQSVNLQFVLRTELALRSSDGSSLASTKPSPAASVGQTPFDAAPLGVNSHRCLVLYNLTFDKDL